MRGSCSELEIGATAGTMLKLQYKGIPDIDSHTYSAYSNTFTRGDKLSIGLGSPTASWTWLTLSQREINVFLSFITSGEASVVVYIKTYTDEGDNLPNMLSSFSAVMHRPQDRNGKNIITNSYRPTYNEVVITFTGLEAI